MHFIEFAYPGRNRPYGVIEVGMPDDVVAYIRERAGTFCRGWSEDSLERQCWMLAPAWCSELSDHFGGMTISLRGGEGAVEPGGDAGDIRPDSPETRSGYLAGSGEIERHYWVTVGPDELIFDPTAHQWDARGGLGLERYRMDGKRFAAWRILL